LEKNKKKFKKMEENDNENENENKEASQDQEILSIIRESRYKQRQNEEEENDCEQLIRLHQNVPGCLLMTEGFHSKKKKFYFCTCDPDCQNPLCINCVQKCHYEHWKKNNKMATAETENTVKVMIRTRPTQHFASKNIRINLSDDTISIFIPRNQKEGLINNIGSYILLLIILLSIILCITFIYILKYLVNINIGIKF